MECGEILSQYPDRSVAFEQMKSNFLYLKRKDLMRYKNAEDAQKAISFLKEIIVSAGEYYDGYPHSFWLKEIREAESKIKEIEDQVYALKMRAFRYLQEKGLIFMALEKDGT